MEERVDFARYLDYVNNAAAREDVEALVGFWYQSTFLYSREESQQVHALIVTKIPELALAHRIPYEGDSFREFVQLYDLTLIDRECDRLTPNKCLWKYAKENNKKGVAHAIEKGPSNWFFALNGAIIGGHLDLVELFWSKIEESGTNLDTQNTREKLDELQTLAGKRGNLDIVKFMVKKDWRGAPKALGGAMSRGVFSLVRFFIDDPDSPFVKQRAINFALYYAALFHKIEILEFLLKCGGDAWYAIVNGAARGGDVELMQRFRQKILSFDTLELTMFEAGLGGSLDAIQYLIEQGVTSQKAMNHGLRGAAEGNHLDAIKFFLSRGADNIEEILVSKKHFNGNVATVELLLQQLPPALRRYLITEMRKQKSHYRPDVVRYLVKA